MDKYLIKNGHLTDPANGINEVMDILISDGKVLKTAVEISENDTDAIGADIINAAGKVVMPGFVDLHVHLREPGFEYKETVMTGAQAAAKGGVTTICPMPNTKPVIDSPSRVIDLIKRAEDAPVNVLPVGAITAGQEGVDINDIAGMKEAGAVAISEDGRSVMDTWIFRQALHQAAEAGMPVFSHCEDTSLVDGGVINAGAKAEELEAIRQDLQKKLDVEVEKLVKCEQAVKVLEKHKEKSKDIYLAEEKAAELKQFSELGVTRFFKQSQERAAEEEQDILKQLKDLEGN